MIMAYQYRFGKGPSSPPFSQLPPHTRREKGDKKEAGELSLLVSPLPGKGRGEPGEGPGVRASGPSLVGSFRVETLS
jgi:hypothetical protein